MKLTWEEVDCERYRVNPETSQCRDVGRERGLKQSRRLSVTGCRARPPQSQVRKTVWELRGGTRSCEIVLRVG